MGNVGLNCRQWQNIQSPAPSLVFKHHQQILGVDLVTGLDSEFGDAAVTVGVDGGFPLPAVRALNRLRHRHGHLDRSLGGAENGKPRLRRNGRGRHAKRQSIWIIKFMKREWN